LKKSLNFSEFLVPLEIKNLFLLQLQILSEGLKLCCGFYSLDRSEFKEKVKQKFSFLKLFNVLNTDVINNNSDFLNNSIKINTDIPVDEEEESDNHEYKLKRGKLNESPFAHINTFNEDSNYIISVINFTIKLNKSVFSLKRLVAVMIQKLFVINLFCLNTLEIKKLFTAIQRDLKSFETLEGITQHVLYVVSTYKTGYINKFSIDPDSGHDREKNLDYIKRALKTDAYSYFVVGVFPIMHYLINQVELDNFPSLHDYEFYIDELKVIVKDFRKFLIRKIIVDEKFFAEEVWFKEEMLYSSISKNNNSLKSAFNAIKYAKIVSYNNSLDGRVWKSGKDHRDNTRRENKEVKNDKGNADTHRSKDKERSSKQDKNIFSALYERNSKPKTMSNANFLIPPNIHRILSCNSANEAHPTQPGVINNTNNIDKIFFDLYCFSSLNTVSEKWSESEKQLYSKNKLNYLIDPERFQNENNINQVKDHFFLQEENLKFTITKTSKPIKERSEDNKGKTINVRNTKKMKSLIRGKTTITKPKEKIFNTTVRIKRSKEVKQGNHFSPFANYKNFSIEKKDFFLRRPLLHYLSVNVEEFYSLFGLFSFPSNIVETCLKANRRGSANHSENPIKVKEDQSDNIGNMFKVIENSKNTALSNTKKMEQSEREPPSKSALLHAKANNFNNQFKMAFLLNLANEHQDSHSNKSENKC